MSRRNIYVLRNLGWATKLAISLGLVLGFALFLTGLDTALGLDAVLGWSNKLELTVTCT